MWPHLTYAEIAQSLVFERCGRLLIWGLKVLALADALRRFRRRPT
jgi:hypothetical protein